MILTAPTGHTYTTTPDGGLYFPTLATPTGALVIGQHTGPPGDGWGLSPAGGRCSQMTRRKRTREQHRRYRIAYERRINEAHLAADPPPF